MKVKCPKCGVIYQIDPSKVAKEVVKLRCKKCGAVFAVRLKKAAPPVKEEKKEAPPPPPPPPVRSVLLAMEDAEALESVASKLKEANFEVTTASDGLKVLDILSSEKPDVLCMDVILPKVFGFEISEIARKRESLKGMKIVLISSYSRDRYVRPSDETYGADKLISPKELENLPAILRELLGDSVPSTTGGETQATPSSTAPAQPQTPPQPQRPPQAAPPSQQPQQKRPSVAQMMMEETKKIEEEFPDLTPEQRQEVEKAKRLARLIVSDIVLYNQEKLEEGIKNNTFFTLLEKEIEDGRKLFEERVPEWIRQKWDFLSEELNKLIERKKKEYGIS